MSKKKKSEIAEEITTMKDGDMNEPITNEIKEIKENTESFAEDDVIDSEVEEDVKPEEKEDIKPMVKEEVKPVIKEEPRKDPVFKKIVCPASAINVRDGAEGNILFTIKNYSKVMVESEADGWTKIVGYVKSELVHEI